MPISDLPTELLQIILRDAAREAKHIRDRGNLPLLRVCKRWHTVGRTVLFDHLQFNAASLRWVNRRLLLAPQRQALGEVKHLVVDVASYEDMYMTDEVNEEGEEDAGDQEEGREGDEDHDESESYDTLQREIQWIADLFLDVNFCDHVLRNCARLKVFYFRCFATPPPIRVVLQLATLSVQHHLTTLVLDTGKEFFELKGQQPHHICPHLACCLHSLRHVRIRMRNICPAVLALAGEGPPTLETVIINLSLHQAGPAELMMQATDCADASETSFVQLRDQMIGAARAATALMPRLRAMMIFYRSLPSWQLFSFDCVTGTRLSVSAEADWEDDGWVQL